MNYQRIYNELVARGKARGGVDGYCEKHHITPRAHGGPDTADNIVCFTAREHFVAHWLLWRIHRTPETAHAFNFMRFASKYNDGRQYLNSYGYAEAKKAFSWAKSNTPVSSETRRKLSEAGKGRVLTAAEREKISQSKLGKKRKPEHIAHLYGNTNMVGKKHSADTKAKIGAAHKGKTRPPETGAKISAAKKGKKIGPFSEEHKAKISATLKQHQRTDEHCKAISDGLKGNTPWNKGKKTGPFSDERKALQRKVLNRPETREKFLATLAAKPDLVCPHCSKKGRGGNMKRYHFDNCKQKAA